MATPKHLTGATAPVQPVPGTPFPPTIPWFIHARAWSQYAAFFGQGQSAQDIADRHGFSVFELVHLLHGRRPGVGAPAAAEVAAVRKEIEEYTSGVAALRWAADTARAHAFREAAQLVSASADVLRVHGWHGAAAEVDRVVRELHAKASTPTAPAPLPELLRQPCSQCGSYVDADALRATGTGTCPCGACRWTMQPLSGGVR